MLKGAASRLVAETLHTFCMRSSSIKHHPRADRRPLASHFIPASAFLSVYPINSYAPLRLLVPHVSVARSLGPLLTDPSRHPPRPGFPKERTNVVKTGEDTVTAVRVTVNVMTCALDPVELLSFT